MGCLLSRSLQDLKARGAWFSTAGQRFPGFENVDRQCLKRMLLSRTKCRASVAADHGDNLPGLRLRLYKPQECHEIGARSSEHYVDSAIDDSADNPIPRMTS